MSENRYKKMSQSHDNRFLDFWSFVRNLDVRTWVVIGMMILVLTVMMGLNAEAWSTFLPPWVAYSLSIFMEVGALAWKFADERPHNSDDQQKLTGILVWMNIVLAVVLMVVNLIRNSLHQNTVGDVTGWDYTAFAMVAISAFGHVAGALLFRQWDERLKNRRTIARQYSQAQFEKQRADGILADTESRLMIREQIADRLSELREKFKNLPPNELNALLKDAKEALEVEYGFDYDNDGKIGKEEPVRRDNHREPTASYASETRDFPKPSDRS